jgi:hypothetical protein
MNVFSAGAGCTGTLEKDCKWFPGRIFGGKGGSYKGFDLMAGSSNNSHFLFSERKM